MLIITNYPFFDQRHFPGHTNISHFKKQAMNTVTVTTTVCVTKEKDMTPAQVKKIVQGIRQGSLQATEANSSHYTEQTANQPDHEKKRVTVALEC